MPFTFSHPSIVLPFVSRRYFSAAGLIMGSMTPDFEYFIRMKLQGDHGHTWAGIFYFDLPVGIVLLFAWFLLISRPLMHNLPGSLATRFHAMHINRYVEYFRLNWMVIIVSLVIGAFSHVLWDGFTHNNTFFTRNISWLRKGVYFFFEDYPVYHILQHVSTGVGLAIVLTAFFSLPGKTFERSRAGAYWPVLIGLTGALAALRFAFMNYEIKIGHVVVILIASAMYSLLITSAIFRHRYVTLRKGGT